MLCPRWDLNRGSRGGRQGKVPVKANMTAFYAKSSVLQVQMLHTILSLVCVFSRWDRTSPVRFGPGFPLIIRKIPDLRRFNNTAVTIQEVYRLCVTRNTKNVLFILFSLWLLLAKLFSRKLEGSGRF